MKTKETTKQILDFKIAKRESKKKLIKMVQVELDKFPDNTEFFSFTVTGIGIIGVRYP